ncbi:TRAP transporter substrate-binding protein [Cellulomonas chengniuliangii]|uniref:TRAP transporter substrate-binding protein n=1 Tax=Cellulomonas chengniuliangii TaxID=2968084 RepID=UPI001D0E9276|nr:TRAP transporter substrate-binding protein [Cellulomonas chengniuliangii]MCC2317969.1 TRAP transporter substrate-binding protein [Cellulomonas chengniuliangii]
MRRNKVVSIAATLGVAALALTACSAGTGTVDKPAGGATGASDGGAAATTVLKLAFNQPETHPQYKALDAMGDRLKERTDGAYDIEIFPNETLGAQRETIELVQAGTIDMAFVAGSLLENFNSDFVVFNLPFTFDSQEHQSEVTNDPEIVGDLYKSLDDQGIRVVSAFHGGIRSVYNSDKPINTPADLAGMKIRVIESDTNLEMMRLMGGTGTPMGQGEVYTAIQSGVIDGGENNELIYANLKHAEIAPYYSYTRHLMFPDFIITNPRVLEAMGPEIEAIFNEEMATARADEAAFWKDDVKTAQAAAEAAGAKFNEVDAEAFATALEPLIESKLSNDVVRDIYAKVRAAAK